MDPDERRSEGVTAAIVDAAPPRTLDFDALYRDERDAVYAYAAFERASRRRGRYDAGKGSPRAWLFGIARNAALDELRRRKRVAAASLPIPSPEPDPGEAAELAAQKQAVRIALGKLGARERELIALKYHAELSNAEIAEVIGVSVTNAGTL